MVAYGLIGFEIAGFRFQQTQIVSPLDSHHAVANIQFAVNVLQVLSGLARRDVQPPGQAVRGQSLAQQTQDSHFANGQTVCSIDHGHVIN